MQFQLKIVLSFNGICYSIWIINICRMLFGFKNAEAAYCRLVQKLVHMLGVEGVLAYLTDILLQTNDVISHVKSLNLVFQAHRAAGIELNADKTFLFKTEVKYLGHLISTEGISLIPAYSPRLLSCPCRQ